MVTDAWAVGDAASMSIGGTFWAYDSPWEAIYKWGHGNLVRLAVASPARRWGGSRVEPLAVKEVDPTVPLQRWAEAQALRISQQAYDRLVGRWDVTPETAFRSLKLRGLTGRERQELLAVRGMLRLLYSMRAEYGHLGGAKTRHRDLARTSCEVVKVAKAVRALTWRPGRTPETDAFDAKVRRERWKSESHLWLSKSNHWRSFLTPLRDTHDRRLITETWTDPLEELDDLVRIHAL